MRTVSSHKSKKKAPAKPAPRRPSPAERKAPAEKPSASFVVYCDIPVDETMQAAIARCIEQYKPVHSTYRLRVKAAKKKVQS